MIDMALCIHMEQKYKKSTLFHDNCSVSFGQNINWFFVWMRFKVLKFCPLFNYHEFYQLS